MKIDRCAQNAAYVSSEVGKRWRSSSLSNKLGDGVVKAFQREVLCEPHVPQMEPDWCSYMFIVKT